VRALRPVWLDGQYCGIQALGCHDFLPRLLGVWAFGGRLPRCTALVLSPCHRVHTLLLPRPLEVVFCDRTGRILRLLTPMATQRLAACPEAAVTWEFRTGTSLRLGLTIGRRLQLAPARAAA
jgi:hypothetical protein